VPIPQGESVTIVFSDNQGIQRRSGQHRICKVCGNVIVAQIHCWEMDQDVKHRAEQEGEKQNDE
jgi:hypothetical protein